MTKELIINIKNIDKVLDSVEDNKVTKLSISDEIFETEDFELGDIFFTFASGERYPNLKELKIEAETKGYSFLDNLENFDKLEKLSLNIKNFYWNDDSYDKTKHVNIEIEDSIKSLKEINFWFDNEPWNLILKQHKEFPNIEKLTFSDFDESLINSWDLLKFPKLRCVLLDSFSYFIEEEESDILEPMYMDDLHELEYLEQISFLALNDINSLKKFKSLKKIGTLAVPYSSDEPEFIEATKGIIIENNTLD